MTLRPFALIPALFLCACAASSTDVDDSESPSSDSEAVSLSDGTLYFHLDSITGTTNAVVSAMNGGSIHCPNGSTAKTCKVDKLVLPADCDWECTDGLLSLRGEGVLRGHFGTSTDPKTHKRSTTLVVAAGFDTWGGGPGTHVVYQLTPTSSTCKAAPCPSTMNAQQLNSNASAKQVTSIDFSKANDTNYVIDPTRGYAQVGGTQGLLASGTISKGVFKADRVWRLWTPKPSCDLQLTARNYWFHGGEDVLDVEVLTEHAGETYVDDLGLGRSIHWLARTAETKTNVTYTAGIYDLWAVRYTIDKTTCALTVTEEH